MYVHAIHLYLSERAIAECVCQLFGAVESGGVIVQSVTEDGDDDNDIGRKAQNCRV